MNDRVLPRWLLAFFLVSGFCSLVYQVVWLRLSMASFGVTTPIVSMVVSVFMAGLAIGSWAAGRLSRSGLLQQSQWSLRLYGLAECVISVSAFSVPAGLVWGRRLIEGMGLAHAGSFGYNVTSLFVLTVVMLPFCFAMGCTFPFALAALRAASSSDPSRRFSRLYAANVAGATLGSLTAAFLLIELLGFRGTLALTAGLNALLATAALALSLRHVPAVRSPEPALSTPQQATTGAPLAQGWMLALLFGTGLASMAMEIVWTRQYTPFLGNLVYSFAAILATYLAATYLGTLLYRRVPRASDIPWVRSTAWYVLIVLSLLPVAMVDRRLPLPDDLVGAMLRVTLGLAPFCAALGFLTPMLVDHYSHGDPQRVGSAYALNTVGCILGPLLASFALLPLLPERWTIVGLAFALLVVVSFARPGGMRLPARPSRFLAPGAAIAACMLAGLAARGLDDVAPGSIVLRDSTATVTATVEAGKKQLWVNGIGMTSLTPITKMMTHAPLALHQGPAEKALIICFGMGTSFRSARSWGLDVTAVELVPSVPALFGYYHLDGPTLLKSPQAHIVIDDGRHFLEWSPERYDLIVIDPPPPAEAAGSSLLYSVEFYQAARAHLRDGGVIEQWIPGDAERDAALAFVHAFVQSFPHVRCFRSVEDWGLHLLGSLSPLDVPTAAVLASRLPPTAAADLIEWYPGATPQMVFEVLLSHEIPPQALAAAAARVPALTDDRPLNEYFILRRWRNRATARPSPP